MDDRWELAVAEGAFWIDDGPSKKLDLLITDGAECGNIYVTPDEACRIALELLRRSNIIPAAVLHLVDGCLPPRPLPPELAG